MTKIIEIEGIGEKYESALEGAGIGTVEKLLDEGASPSGREKIAEKTGVTAQRVLEWVNRADLMRIQGVGSEYSDLLEAAGVDTVKELATRRADDLYAKLEEVNSGKKLVRRTPTAAEVERWVAEAKASPPRVSYGQPGGGLSDAGRAETVVRIPVTAGSGKAETFELTQAVLDLISEAATIFGSTDDAIAWLNAPNRSVGGVAPRALFEKGIEGVQEAKAILFRLEEGIYS